MTGALLLVGSAGLAGLVVGAALESVPLLIGSAVAFFGGFLGASLRLKRRKEAAYAQASARLGFTYTPGDPAGLGRLPLPLMRHRGAATDVLTGTWGGTPVYYFTYQWEERSGSTTTTSWKFCALALRRAAFPTVAVGQEGLMSRMARGMGMEDIEVGWDQFDRTYKVRADDPAFARDLLHPAMQQWMLTNAPDWGFEISQHYVLAIPPTGGAALVENTLHVVNGFLQMIPADLDRRYPVSTG